MDMKERISTRRKELGLTLAEVGDFVGVGKSTVRKWETGDIANMRRDKIALLADVLKVTPAYLMGWEEEVGTKNPLPPNIYPIEEDDFVTMPVLASVKAGYDGVAVVEYSDEIISVFKPAFKGYPKDECTVMRIVGDSMYPKLLDNDLILVHVQSSVDSGSTAIVIYNGDEATVKKVRYVPGEDWVELVPTNPEYQTKRIEGEDLEECRVFALVLGLVYRDI